MKKNRPPPDRLYSVKNEYLQVFVCSKMDILSHKKLPTVISFDMTPI